MASFSSIDQLVSFDCLHVKVKTIMFMINRNSVEVKFVWQISYPPENRASLGSHFCVKNL